MYTSDHHSLEELKTIRSSCRSSEIRQRLQIIILAKESKTSFEIARELGFARSTCLIWVKRYNEESLPGLENKHPKGKEKLLNSEEEARFRARIENGPKQEEKICVFRGKEIQKILEKEFNKLRCLSSIYYLLHSLGYSLLSPRPKHPKSSQEAQDLFKKKLKKKSKRFKKNM